MNTFFGFEVVGSICLGVCFFHLSKRLDALIFDPLTPYEGSLLFL